MPRPSKKRRVALPPKMGQNRQYLTDNFSNLPEDITDLKNGHILLLFITNDKSPARTVKAVMEKYMCNITPSKVNSLRNFTKKFADSTSEIVRRKYAKFCCERFILNPPEVQASDSPGPSASISRESELEVPETPKKVQSSKKPGTRQSPKKPGTTQSPKKPRTMESPRKSRTTQSPKKPETMHSPKMLGARQSPKKADGINSAKMTGAMQSPKKPGNKQSHKMPGTRQSILKVSRSKQSPIKMSGTKQSGKNLGSNVRSSKRELITPRKQRLKKRLEFVAHSRNEMKKKYKRKVEELQSRVDFQLVHQIKYLKQEINRKKLVIAKQKAKIKLLNLNTASKEELNELKKKIKNERKKHRRTLKILSKSAVTDSESADYEIQQLKAQLNGKNKAIQKLENENLCLKESVDSLQSVESKFQKKGKTFSMETRMLVYDCIVNNVPTKNVPVLIRQFAMRSATVINQVPHGNTVEFMARELGVVSDFMAAELLLDTKNLTLGFDATTQEGMHVNSIHITSTDKCYVLGVDQLPGGTAEDYDLHINETLDCLTNVYCQFYSKDFEETRQKIISNISNTMTDRASVNHATIQRLELSWRKNLNELNCHLHPLDTIASSVRTALKANEPHGLVKKLYGTECISHQLILAFNKFQYKDGRGDPKGFTSALESAGLPKGLLPRYRGNRLHIMFDISGKLHQHEDFFMKLLSETTVACGGLQSSLLHDYMSQVAKVELHVLGLLGKLLSGPWMKKFYTSRDSEVSHVDGIQIVKVVLDVLKYFSENALATLTTAKDFFGNDISVDATLKSLQQKPANEELFTTMMESCLVKTIEVLERQYMRYFGLDITETLRKETESSRCHNIDAESIMGMFSAAKGHAPNATMSFLSARIRASKNNVVDYLDNLSTEKKHGLVQLATKSGRKLRIKQRKKSQEIKAEIAKRLGEKLQKRKTSDRKKLEKRIKNCSLSNVFEEFTDFDKDVIEAMTDLLTGRVVGHQICHVWYDSETQEQTLYFGKFEKLLKKAGGTYRVGYWLEGESYEENAEDYDISKYALAADLICGDLTMS